MAEAASLLQADDGGYVVIGQAPADGRYRDNAWIMKLDAAGNVVWRRLYDSGRGMDVLSSVQRAANGGYIVIGPHEGGSYDSQVVRLDERANVIWAKTLGGMPHAQLWAAAKGHLVTARTSWAHDYENDVLIKNIDDGGGVIWQKTYRNIGGIYFAAIRATPDGGHCVAAWGRPGRQGSLALKLDADGNINWQKSFDPDWAGTFLDVRATADGGCVILGKVRSTSFLPPSASLLKLDSVGNISWQKKYEGIVTDVLQSSTDGGFAMPVSIAYAPFASVMKVDGRGDVVWLRTYGFPRVTRMQVTSDGGYLLGGGASDGDSLALLKLSAEGSADGCPVAEERSLTPVAITATATDGTVQLTSSSLPQGSVTVSLTDVATVTRDFCPAP